MGEGILKDRVPEAHTDYIIAVISEEFGALFVLFIVILFLFIGYRVLNKVFLEKNEFGQIFITDTHKERVENALKDSSNKEEIFNIE